MNNGFEALSIGVNCAECGLCCSKKCLCENCEKATLRCNGLPIELAPQIHGLSKVWNGNGRFQYSDLYKKIQQLLQESGDPYHTKNKTNDSI